MVFSFFQTNRLQSVQQETVAGETGGAQDVAVAVAFKNDRAALGQGVQRPLLRSGHVHLGMSERRDGSLDPDAA